MKHSKAWKAQPLADRLLHVLTEYDRKQSTRRGYNIYALAHYMAALARIREDLAGGIETRRAITSHFCGQLANLCLREAGLPVLTDAEKRGSLADYGLR